jgi:hypothetical protein
MCVGQHRASNIRPSRLDSAIPVTSPPTPRPGSRAAGSSPRRAGRNVGRAHGGVRARAAPGHHPHRAALARDRAVAAHRIEPSLQDVNAQLAPPNRRWGDRVRASARTRARRQQNAQACASDPEANRAHTGRPLIGGSNVRFSRGDRRFRHITGARDHGDVPRNAATPYLAPRLTATRGAHAVVVIRWSEGTPNEITRIRRLVQHGVGLHQSSFANH